MLEITKEIAKEIKEAKSVSVSRDAAGRGVMTLHFQDCVRGETVRTHKSWLITASLTRYECRDYDTQEVFLSRDPETSACYASADLYPNYHAHSVMSTIRTGDKIRFEFVANAGNLHLGKAGFHMDTLKILIFRGDKWKEFELETTVNPGNIARMINGASRRSVDPTSYEYQNREVAEV